MGSGGPLQLLGLPSRGGNLFREGNVVTTVGAQDGFPQCTERSAGTLALGRG